MNWDLLMTALPPIPLHALAALLALAIGIIQMIQPKGTPLHRWLGRLWVGLMALVALSSFFIHELRIWGRFSPIHLLSLFTLASLYMAVQAARRGDIRRHRQIMTALFWLALVVTGGFTLMPGRIMYLLLFGQGG